MKAPTQGLFGEFCSGSLGIQGSEISSGDGKRQVATEIGIGVWIPLGLLMGSQVIGTIATLPNYGLWEFQENRCCPAENLSMEQQMIW